MTAAALIGALLALCVLAVAVLVLRAVRRRPDHRAEWIAQVHQADELLNTGGQPVALCAGCALDGHAVPAVTAHRTSDGLPVAVCRFHADRLDRLDPG